MKCTKIGWGKTVSDNNYGNSKIYLEVDLEEGDIPDETLKLLQESATKSIEDERGECGALHAREQHLNKLEHDIDALEAKLASAKKAWISANAEWAALVSWAEKQGLKIQTQFPKNPWLYDQSDLPLVAEAEVDDVTF